MENIQNRIARAIGTTRRAIPEYFEKTVSQRLPKTGAGSVVVGFENTEELEKVLVIATWEAYSHPTIMAETEASITKNVRGLHGMIELVDLPTETIVILDDRKNTGKVSAIVKDIRGQEVDFTVIIFGIEQDEEVIIFTFYPGDPITPSVVQVTSGLHGKSVAIFEARSMGIWFFFY